MDIDQTGSVTCDYLNMTTVHHYLLFLFVEGLTKGYTMYMRTVKILHCVYLVPIVKTLQRIRVTCRQTQWSQIYFFRKVLQDIIIIIIKKMMDNLLVKWYIIM
jgi:hypothetical protein